MKKLYMLAYDVNACVNGRCSDKLDPVLCYERYESEEISGIVDELNHLKEYYPVNYKLYWYTTKRERNEMCERLNRTIKV